MKKREDIESKTQELILPFTEQKGLELVDVDFEKEGSDYYLRVYIDKPGGVTIDDCEDISRSFNDVLDREAYIDQQYIFEVSSPGLGRPLKKEKDYVRSMGKEVEIRLYRAIDHEKEFCGVLSAYDENTVTIEDESYGQKVFDKKDIALIRLAIDF